VAGSSEELLAQEEDHRLVISALRAFLAG